MIDLSSSGSGWVSPSFFFKKLLRTRATSSVSVKETSEESLFCRAIPQYFTMPVEGKNIGISFEYAGVARHSDCHQIEFAMVTLLRTCRLLTNRHLPASRVSFVHRRTNSISE